MIDDALWVMIIISKIVPKLGKKYVGMSDVRTKNNMFSPIYVLKNKLRINK